MPLVGDGRAVGIVLVVGGRQLSFNFPSTGERFASLTDQLAIVTGLWETPVGETFSSRS